jgi:hypothetical protein
MSRASKWVEILALAAAGVVAGGFAAAWFRAPRPMIVIRAIEFAPHLEEVRIPPALQEMSRDDSWARSLEMKESFETLVDDMDDVESTIERLDHGLTVAKTWLYAACGKDGGGEYLTQAEVLKTPYFLDDVVGSSLAGEVRRGTEIQLDREALRREQILPLRKTIEGWEIRAPRQITNFPSESDDPAAQALVEDIARSFATGARRNLCMIHQSFLETTTRERAHLVAYRDDLRKLLEEQALLRIRVAVFNPDSSPLLLEQEFVLEMTSLDKEGTKIALQVVRGSRGGSEGGFTRQVGMSIQVIPPNEILSFELEPVHDVSPDDRERIRSGAVALRITAEDPSGREFRSPSQTFSASPVRGQ